MSTRPHARAPARRGATRSASADAILLEDVDTLGEKGAVVDVSKGYLRNYLIPRKLAAPATKGALQEAQRRAEADEKAARDAVDRAQEHAATAQQDGADDRPAGRRRRPPVRLGDDAGHRRRDPRGPRDHDRPPQVHLDEPIKSVGTYMVVVEVADGLTATVKTIVTEQ